MIKGLHICLLTQGRIFELAAGGEEKFTISLGNWLARQSYDVTLMGSGFASVKAKRLYKFSVEEDEKRVTKQKKIKVLYPPYPVYALSRLVLSLLWVLKILSINIKSPITLIHAQDTGYSGLAAVISGKFLRIPVIITSHGIRHKTAELITHGRFEKAMLKIEYSLDLFTIKNANSFIVVNPSIKNYYGQITSKKIDVIPVPIKLGNFKYSEVNRDLIRKELVIDKKTKVIGFVGRFSSEKNLLTLLTSFADVAHDDPLIKLVLVGGGILESQLREYVSKRGIEDRVVFCGVRYDIHMILSSFDIFVLPSYIEGLSTALLELWLVAGLLYVAISLPTRNW